MHKFDKGRQSLLKRMLCGTLCCLCSQNVIRVHELDFERVLRMPALVLVLMLQAAGDVSSPLPASHDGGDALLLPFKTPPPTPMKNVPFHYHTCIC